MKLRKFWAKPYLPKNPGHFRARTMSNSSAKSFRKCNQLNVSVYLFITLEKTQMYLQTKLARNSQNRKLDYSPNCGRKWRTRSPGTTSRSEQSSSRCTCRNWRRSSTSWRTTSQYRISSFSKFTFQWKLRWAATFLKRKFELYIRRFNYDFLAQLFYPRCAITRAS